MHTGYTYPRPCRAVLLYLRAGGVYIKMKRSSAFPVFPPSPKRANVVVDQNTQRRAWGCAVDRARKEVASRTGKPATAGAIWALICNECDAPTANDPDFFSTLCAKDYYPLNDLVDIHWTVVMPLATTFFQTVLNAAGQSNNGYIYNDSGEFKDRWITSINGMDASVTDEVPKVAHQCPLGPRADVMCQTAAEVESNAVTISLSQCERLHRNGVHRLYRPEHALFVEDHPATKQVVVNDPNYSSLQDLERVYRSRLPRADSWTAGPYNKSIRSKYGFCQTWSAFELECNFLKVPGLHQQLLVRYFDQNEPDVGFT